MTRKHVALTLLAVIVLTAACEDATNPGVGDVLPPPSVSAEPLSTSSMRVAWPRVEGAGSYRVERRVDLEGPFIDFRTVSQPADSVVALVDSGLEPATFYGYRVYSQTALGTESQPSTVAGARTPPPPGLRIFAITSLRDGAPGDPDGYLAVVRGDGGEFSTAVPPNGNALISPVPSGSYTVRLEGVAEGCEVSGIPEKEATVTTSGIITVTEVRFQVACSDPTRGDIRVEVLTLGDTLPETNYLLRLTGTAGSEAISDTLPVIPRTSPGTVVSFRALEVGSYQTRLTRYPNNICSVQGDSIRSGIVVEPLVVDTIRYSVICRAPGDTTGLPIEGRFVDRTGSEVTTVQPGQEVILQIFSDVPDSLDLTAFQADLSWDASLLRATAGADYDAGAEDNMDQFTSNVGSANRPDGLINFQTFSLTGVPNSGLQGIGAITFETLALGDAIFSLDISTAAPADGSGNIDTAVQLPDLRIDAGGGSVPPVARPGGPYSDTVGAVIQFDGSGSSDPDGGDIVKWIWRWGDGAADSVSGATAAHAYGAEGNYTVELVVEDDEGERGSAQTVATITVPGAEQRLVGRWLDVGRTPLAAAPSVGDTVQLAVCADAPLQAFQSDVSYPGSVLRLLSGSDLNTATAGLADCPAASDVIDQFTLGAVSSNPVNFQTFSLSTTPGSGFQGLALFQFEVEAEGTATVDFDISTAQVFGGGTPTLLSDVDSLLVGTGGSGGSPGSPTADAGGPYTGAPGVAVAFDASGSAADIGASLVRYIWRFGDGSPPDTTAGPTNQHTYAAVGSYQLALEVEDDQGASDSDTASVSIAEPLDTDYAWQNRWADDRALPGEVIFLDVRTRPARSFANVSGDVAFDPTVLRYDSARAGPAFDFIFSASQPRQGLLRVSATASANLTGTRDTDVGRVFFSVIGDLGDSTATATGNVQLRTASLTPVSTAGLAIVEDTVAVLDFNRPPTVQANGPYEAIEGLPLTFSSAGTVDSDGGLASLEWDFGDGTTASDPEPTHTYTAQGSYTVILTATDNDGASASDTTRASVGTTEFPEARANGPYSAVVGRTVSFSASGSQDVDGSIVSYEWDFGDGTGASGPAPQHVYSQSGTYTVILTVRDDVGAPGADTTTATVVLPSSFSVKNTWTVPASQADTLSGVVLAPPVEGPAGQAGPGDPVILKLSSNPGVAYERVVATVGWDGPVLRFDSASVGGGFSTFTTTPGTNSVSYEAVATSPPPVGSEVEFGNLYFTVTGVEGDSTTSVTSAVELTDAAGANPVDLEPLSVIESTLRVFEGSTGGQNQPPSAEAGGPYSGEAGQAIGFQGSGSDPDGSVVRYDWDFGDGTQVQDAGTATSHTYATDGIYTARLTVFDNLGETGVDSAAVTVSPPPPNTPPVADAGGPYEADVGQEITLDGTASADPDGTIASYAWAFSDGGTATGSQPAVTFSQADTVEVVLTVTDDDGGSASDTTRAVVSEPPPTPNLAGVWTDAEGATISQAAVGDTVFLQLCAVGSGEAVQAFQSDITGYAGVASYEQGQSSDLDTPANGVGACASAGTDVINQATFGADQGGLANFQTFSLSSSAGGGPQGLGSVAFVLAASGSLEVSLNVSTFALFSGDSLSALPSIPALAVN